jgi:hypothetical protein
VLFDFVKKARFARLMWRFRDYTPRPVTFKGLHSWINQYELADQPEALSLLEGVKYLSESDVKRELVRQNEALLRKLRDDSIPFKNVIFVSIDTAGSSSAVILHMLRDACHLERRGCRLYDSRDVLGISEASTEINQGAIVYVDDFCATGTQICRSRDFVAENLIGTFAEFFVVACICEEALYKLGERNVEARAAFIHSKAERPLHEQGTRLADPVRQRLRELCTKADRKGGLGYRNLATNIVLYRNSPNTTPALIRGIKGQDVLGVLPRTDDLPIPPL